MAGRCELCNGKVVNERCVECGMDYSRMKKRYYLNENCSDYDQNARKINTSYENSLRGKGESSGNKKKEKTRLNAKASVKPNVAKKWTPQTFSGTTAKSGKSFVETVASVSKTAKSAKKKLSWGKKIIIIIAVLAAVAEPVLSVVGDILDDLFSSSSVTPVYSEIEETPVYDDEDTIEMPEMPETGDSVDFDLPVYGCYVAGVDIPVGTYAFTNTDGEYSVSLLLQYPETQDSQNIYLDAGEYVEGICLYEGTILHANSYFSINCMSDNAQTEEMHDWEGDTGEYVVLTAEDDEEVTYTVGEDIVPGRYTARYIGDAPSVYGINVEGDDYWDYLSLSSAVYDAERAQYAGLILEEGDIVHIQRFGTEEASVELVPQTERTGNIMQ